MRKKNYSWILNLIWTSILALSLIFTSAARMFSRQSGTTQSKGLSCIIQFSCRIMTHSHHFMPDLALKLRCVIGRSISKRATLKDLFNVRIRDVEVQRQLIRAKAYLDDTLQLALENEKGAKTSEQLQKLLPHNNATSNTTNSIRVKQEPTSSVQQFKSQGNSSRGGDVNRPNQRQNQNKPCYFCGNPFSLEHRRSCPAREATCNACKKKGHFAKVCNTTRRRVNMVQNEEMSTNQECNLIDVNGDSEPEYGVMAIDVVQINNVELKTAGGQPRSLSI